jgi:hypothetical protein
MVVPSSFMDRGQHAASILEGVARILCWHSTNNLWLFRAISEVALVASDRLVERRGRSFAVDHDAPPGVPGSSAADDRWVVKSGQSMAPVRGDATGETIEGVADDPASTSASPLASAAGTEVKPMSVPP